MNINQFWEYLDGQSHAGSVFTPESIILSLVLAFVLGQALAWVYYFTHSGLSYSKSFVQSLVMMSIIVAMIMGVIGHSIITAFGLMGALAIIRFRNVVKDTRDIVFIFCALIVGMASGTQNYSIAILGTIFLSFVAIYMHVTGFGSHQSHNGFLRFSFPGHIEGGHPIVGVLKKFCGNYTLISAHDSGYGDSLVEHAYQLMVRNAQRNEQMLSELEKLEGVTNVSLTMQEQLLEV